MSIATNYLSINKDYSDLEFLGIYNSINSYQKYYLQYGIEPESVKENLISKIKTYIDNIYNMINIENADINYYIENINTKSKIKFKQVIKDIDIDHLISMMDYKDKKVDSYYKYFQSEYYKYFNMKIINGVYNLAKNPTHHLHEQIDEFWSNINFENIINFTHTLNRMKYFGQNVEIFQHIIENKFDSKDNIKKLTDYIVSNFVEESDLSNDLDEFSEDNDKEKRFNFRFVIENLKSHGFSLFEDYFVQIKSRYKQQINIEHVKKDKKLVYYFMQIISSKDSNSVNRYVNDMLIRIRDYLYDIEDSYNNNIAYAKIRVEKSSEKYAELDLTQLKRENYNFTVFKYCFADELVSKFKPTKKLEPYLDIYRAYYKSRYPDRDFEIDIIKSTMVTKIKFDKIYYVHLTLIQYLVYDIIYKSDKDGIGILEISTQTDIPVSNLQETINSLIKIKLIARSADSTIENIKLVCNNNFTYEKNKISIASMIIKDKIGEQVEKVKEFMFDKSMIVLCNIIDYVKKNNYFYEDTIEESIKYKIPFTVTQELVKKAIEEALKKEMIKKIDIPPSNPTITKSGVQIVEQVMYQLAD